MSDLRKEDVEAFWKACGWRESECNDNILWIRPDGKHIANPPDHSDLCAILDALEWFCERTDWKNVEIRLCKDLPPELRGKLQWRIQLFMPSYQQEHYGGTLQEAIIKAVNTASRDSA